MRLARPIARVISVLTRPISAGVPGLIRGPLIRSTEICTWDVYPIEPSETVMCSRRERPAVRVNRRVCPPASATVIAYCA